MFDSSGQSSDGRISNYGSKSSDNVYQQIASNEQNYTT